MTAFLTFCFFKKSCCSLFQGVVFEVDFEVLHGPQDGQHALHDVAEHHRLVQQTFRLVEALKSCGWKERF